jgi:hypothetical protein
MLAELPEHRFESGEVTVPVNGLKPVGAKPDTQGRDFRPVTVNYPIGCLKGSCENALPGQSGRLPHQTGITVE